MRKVCSNREKSRTFVPWLKNDLIPEDRTYPSHQNQVAIAIAFMKNSAKNTNVWTPLACLEVWINYLELMKNFRLIPRFTLFCRYVFTYIFSSYSECDFIYVFYIYLLIYIFAISLLTKMLVAPTFDHTLWSRTYFIGEGNEDHY